MKPIQEEDIRDDAVLATAKRIAVAARTAPKGKGKDNLVITVFDKKGTHKFAEAMIELVEKEGYPEFFRRDAENLKQSSAMVVLGTKIEPLNISPCGFCGFENCDEKRKHPDIPCAFNTGDLGIAVGSAAGMAADCRLDNRIMYTVGRAAVRHKFLGDEVKVAYGIPLSASGKSPFFDRG
jgi:uncharacterized ferredoxin-like protein